MAIVTINFDYKLPNEYLSMDDSEGLIGNIDYVGPEAVFAFVDKNTGVRDIGSGFMIFEQESDWEIARIHGGLDNIPVKVIAANTPLIAALIVPQEYDVKTYPIKEYRLDGDDTVYYSRPDPTWPNHTYSSSLKYNFASETWITPGYLAPHITFDEWNSAREVVEQSYRAQLENDESLTAEQKTALQGFIDEIDALPTKFAGWSPWQIPFPATPEILMPDSPEVGFAENGTGTPIEADFDPDWEGTPVDPDAPAEPAPDNGPIPVT